MTVPSLPAELRNQMFTLTLALYRVTDFFSPNEPLRKHLREKANEIFEEAIEYGYHEETVLRRAVTLIGKIDAIKGYLHIAESLKIVQPVNLKILNREYAAVFDFFHAELEKEEDKGKDVHEERSYKNVKPKDQIEPHKTREVIYEERAALGAEKTQMQNFSKEGVRTSREKSKEKEATNNVLNDRQKKILTYLATVHQARISDFFDFFNTISSKTIQRDLKDMVMKDFLKREGDKRGTIYKPIMQMGAAAKIF